MNRPALCLVMACYDQPKMMALQVDTWERYFKFIANNCSFMHGKNDRDWVANFDFCIRESAMVNVMENKYVDRK